MKFEITGKTVSVNEKNNSYGFEYKHNNRTGLLGDSNCSSSIPVAIDEQLQM